MSTQKYELAIPERPALAKRPHMVTAIVQPRGQGLLFDSTEPYHPPEPTILEAIVQPLPKSEHRPAEHRPARPARPALTNMPDSERAKRTIHTAADPAPGAAPVTEPKLPPLSKEMQKIIREFDEVLAEITDTQADFSMHIFRITHAELSSSISLYQFSRRLESHLIHLARLSRQFKCCCKKLRSSK